MADQKISAMPGVGTFTGTELFPVVQGGINKSCSFTILVQSIFDFGNAANTGPLYQQDNGAKIYIGSDGVGQSKIDGNGSANLKVTNGGSNIFMNSGGFVMQDTSNNNIAMFPSAQIQINSFAGDSINLPGTGVINLLWNDSLMDALNGAKILDASHNYYDLNDNQILTVRQSSVANPTGGTVIDVQARAQLVLLLTAMRNHGLIGP